MVSKPVHRLFRVLPIAIGLSVLLCGVGAAQVVTTKGDFLFGTRQISGELGSSKFLEYRAIPEGFFLSVADISLDWLESGYYMSLRAKDALEGDQNIAIRAGRRGRIALSLDFDRTPHVFTNSGRSIYTQEGAGTFRIPKDVRTLLGQTYSRDIDPNQSGTQRDLAALQAVINGLARPVDLSLLREKGTVGLRYTPAPGWDVKAQYSLEHRKGTRPFGATFSFAPTEQPEPIDYNAHEIRLNAERSTPDWSLQLGYVGSILRNEIDVMTFDNPFQAVDASGNPAAGRIDLYPNNNYHQGTIGGVVRLPANSRFSATASWGVSSQNDELIPFTINTALTGVPSLPARTADARFETLVFNTTLSSRPVPDLTLGLRYRLYDRNNESKDRTITGYVRTDQSVSAVARRNVPIAYSRQNLAADASWAIRSDVTLRGGYEWEGWERDFRETLSTDENTLGASLDVVPVNWLSVRAAYRRSDKTANDYDVERVIEELFPDGEPAGGLSPLHELRKFDQASRERNRAELIARLIPGDKLDLTATYTLTDDNYDESQYGVLDNDNRGPAVEVSYSVTPQFSVFADYARDTNRWNMKSRQRQPGNDKPANDWLSNIEDRLDTFGLGLNGTAGPEEKLQMSASYTYSDGWTRIHTSTLPGAQPDLVTTAESFPKVDNKLQSVLASVGYRLGENIAAQLEYRFEKYDEVDFGLDDQAPFMGFIDAGSANAVFLGVRRPDYRAHIVSLSLRYGF